MDKPPKLKEKLTDGETASQLAKERIFKAYNFFFNILEREDPKLAKKIQPDLNEFKEVLGDMIEEDPHGEYTIADIQKIIPDNLFIKILKPLKDIFEKGPPLTSKGERERVSKDFKRDLEKRKEEKDIN